MKVFGKNVFNEIKDDIKNIRRIYLSKNFKDDKIFKIIKDNNLRYEIIENNRLDKMVDGNHQGIIVEINDYEYYKLDDVLDEETFRRSS